MKSLLDFHGEARRNIQIVSLSGSHWHLGTQTSVDGVVSVLAMKELLSSMVIFRVFSVLQETEMSASNPGPSDENWTRRLSLGSLASPSRKTHPQTVLL